MDDAALVKQFANDVYLTKFNRFIDGIDDPEDEDAATEVLKVCRWASLYVEELELETDDDGRTINWNFLRENDVDFGTLSVAGQTFELPTGYRKLVVDQRRPLTIGHDGTIISRFSVVEPNQITKRTDGDTGDRVTMVGRKLLFSRPFRDYELGGTLIGDGLKPIPRMTVTDAAMLRTVPYYELLVLGVAKNATLPGIVEGGLSPSLTQKYADLLTGAKTENENSSLADEMVEDDFSNIGGVW